MPLLSVGGFQLTARLAPYSDAAPILAYFVGFSCVVLATLGVALGVPEQRTAGRVVAGAGGVLWGAGALAPTTGGYAWPALCVLAGLLILGTGLGAAIGRRIQEPAHLLFVALVSGVADTLSVVQPGGISKAIAEEPAALALLALPWPLLGTSEIAPLLGVSDVVFASLYLHAARTHGLSVPRTWLALAVAFAATAVLVVLTERTIPVLPLLGLGVVAVQPRARAASGS